MARIRTIKPEIASDVKLASVSRDARYTFVLLISQSDDEGLVAGSHRQLLGALYPHDNAVTTADLLGWVEELIALGLVRWRATSEGAPVLEITNWTKHQRVDNKGRSQLAGLLVPLAGNLPPVAETRGEPPRTAELRGSEEGSRTKEVGPRTEDRRPPPAGDHVDAFLSESDFGACVASVAGLIRSSRNPPAVIATLRMHLSGEMSHEHATPAELGLACQQYQANGEPFKSAYFAGFVRRAKHGAERTSNRRRNAAEAQYMASEQRDRETAAAETVTADRELETFAGENPERYAELLRIAESGVPKKLTLGREIMVRAQLLRLVREEKAA